MSFPTWSTDTAFVFLSLFVQGIPFLLLGALISGFVGAYVPLRPLFSRIPKNPFLAAILGGGLGFVIPSCECVAIPVMRRFFQQGLPLSAGLAYLLASPVLNPICLFSTWIAYQGSQPWKVVALRASGGFLLAVTACLVLSRFSPSRILRGEILLPGQTSDAPDPLDPSASPASPRWLRALGTSLADFRQVALFYIGGSLAAALFQILLPPQFIPGPASWWATPALMSLAILLSVCSSADAFLANSFTGFPLHAQLAFLWTGPVLDLKLLLVYQTLLQRRAILLLSALVIILAGLMAFAASFLR